MIHSNCPDTITAPILRSSLPLRRDSARGAPELKSLVDGTRRALLRLCELAPFSRRPDMALALALEQVIAHLAEYHQEAHSRLVVALTGARFQDVLMHHFDSCAHRQVRELERLHGSLTQAVEVDQLRRTWQVAALVMLAEFDTHAADLQNVLAH